MVVFTCGHCGESVQKPKVEKHYLTKCRNRNPNLSCMDCFKDFFGNDYEQHTKCVTEEQRYAAKGFVAKEKKGEQKQNVWVELVQSVLDEQKTAPRNVLRILEAVSKHNNTPRKKPKFINFVKNICGNKTNPKDIDGAWDLLSVKLSALASNNQNNKNQKTNQNGTDTNSAREDKENDSKVENNLTNGHSEDNGEAENGTVENGRVENGTSENGVEGDSVKKLTKKQRKEEKKRKKYEAELASAAELPKEELEDEAPAMTKKDKKKKNRTESVNNGDADQEVDNGKNKKRKRQDTVNAANDVIVPPVEIVDEKQVVLSEKAKQKKLKVDQANEDLANESVCLHDQNVANGEHEPDIKPSKFDWHEVIISVLQKKGNEMQFKRLQKKVLGEYSEATGQDVDDRIADKFIKKLKSAPKVRVDKNRVTLEE